MNSARSFLVKWLITSLLPLAAASTSQALAQGGFGPDPYRPFNQQYDSFVYPVAPGTGDVVPSEAAMSRAGMSRSNQFQDYMRGIGETGTYRSQRRLDPKDFRDQQYQPNRKVDENSGYYEKQDFVSQAYFSYIRERDPKKRAELLKEYQKARSKPAREFAPSETRRRSAKKEGSPEDEGRSATASRLEKSKTSRTPRLGADSTEAPLRGSSSRGGTSVLDPTKPTAPATPSEILERSLKRERLRSLNSGSGSSTTPPSLRSRAPGRVPPPPTRRGPSSIPDIE